MSTTLADVAEASATSATVPAAWTPPDILQELGAEELSDLLMELVGTFKGDTEVRLQMLREAVAAGDVESVRKAAHSMKGSAAQMGADDIASACREIETAVDEGCADRLQELAAHVEQLFAVTRRAMDQYVRNSGRAF
jgi:HPt (histidine-containing phosphotransfer) domain-containing protein